MRKFLTSNSLKCRIKMGWTQLIEFCLRRASHGYIYITTVISMPQWWKLRLLCIFLPDLFSSGGSSHHLHLSLFLFHPKASVPSRTTNACSYQDGQASPITWGLPLWKSHGPWYHIWAIVLSGAGRTYIYCGNKGGTVQLTLTTL